MLLVISKTIEILTNIQLKIGGAFSRGARPRFTPENLIPKEDSYIWNVAFCTADADRDRKSNGDELGDPCCEWIKDGEHPRHVDPPSISNPSNVNSTTTRPSCVFSRID